MATIQVNFMSKSLFRTVDIQVILPVDKFDFFGASPRADKPFKTLYLLHGVFGDYHDWIKSSRIALWAEENNLAVVMPAGENMFYVDNKVYGNNYSKFIGEELVEITRKMFPLSNKREDTFIAGLSMGGYGAIHNGFKYHETFSHVAALSPALVVEDAVNSTYEDPFFLHNRSFYERFFDDLDNILKTDINPEHLIHRLNAEGVDLPKLYFACGESDDLLIGSEKLAEFLTKERIPYTYEKGPGIHDWYFWDTYIKKVLDWLPLEEKTEGLHSGNVGQ